MPGASRTSEWAQAFRQQMSSKAGVWWATLVAILLTLPTIQAGLIGDDYLFREIFSGRNPGAHPGSLFGLFTFSDGSPEHIRQLRETGTIPWWTAEHVRMSFWRPLTELTHWLDHLLWPDSPVFMHLQSIAWYGFLVFLLARFYRQLDPLALRANLGALVFGMSAMHLLTVIWLAARNQLVAACMIVLCLTAHDAWRRLGKSGERWMAWLWFACALAAAEAGIAAAAYLVAYALFMERGRPATQRLLSILPYLLAVVLWRHQYNVWGYGSQGLGGYIDPGADPDRFLVALSMRLPTLLLAAVTGITSTALLSFPVAWKFAYALMAVLALCGLLWALKPLQLWRSDALRFLAGGAVLALVPVCAAEVNDRLLINAELGLSAVLGTLFVRLFSKGGLAKGFGQNLAARRVVVTLAVVHLVVFPVFTGITSLTVSRVLAVATHDEPASLPNVPESSGQHMVLLNPPSALFAGYFRSVRLYMGLQSGASLGALSSGDQEVALDVLDSYTIRMSVSRGFGDEVTRDLIRHPFHVGERMDAGAYVVTVDHVNAVGRADVVRMRFKLRLDDPGLAFFAWSDDGYVRFHMPAADPTGLSTVHFARASLGHMIRRRFGLSK